MPGGVYSSINQSGNTDIYGLFLDTSWWGCCCGGCLPVAVVVVVLLVVEAAVLEGLVPFLVPVTNSICETTHNTSECQLELKYLII